MLSGQSGRVYQKIIDKKNDLTSNGLSFLKFLKLAKQPRQRYHSNPDFTFLSVKDLSAPSSGVTFYG